MSCNPIASVNERRIAPQRTRSCQLSLFRTAVLCLTAAIASTAVAQTPAPVPALLPYEGLVYLENGSNDLNREMDIEFRLYDAPVQGNLLWAELQSNVRVSGGKFSIILGGGTAVGSEPHGSLSDALKVSPVYVELKADGVSIRVRQQFTTTPHAFKVQNAYSADHGVPPGTVMPFAGGVVPPGWRLCDGTSYPTTGEYAALFSAIGYVWGGSGGTFKVPNLGGRLLAGVGTGQNSNSDNSSSGMTSRPLGTLKGQEKHTLTVAQLPAHTHDYTDRHWNKTQDVGGTGNVSPADNSTQDVAYTTGATGGSQSHNNMQPSAVVNFIIKY